MNATSRNSGNNGKSEKTADAKEETPSRLAQTAEDLFNFAIDRADVRALMGGLPETAEVKRSTVEYELPILKIISVGWAISYFLPDGPQKAELTERYWAAVSEFSAGLSETTGLMIGREIDYFQTLRERLTTYVNALADHPEATEPAAVIGPEFARLCGNVEDVFAIMTGNRMFIATVGGVKEYLEAIRLR
ncbi:MAG: hypothetical protein ACLFRG_16765 [Desulfococcaceae bacterium]